MRIAIIGAHSVWPIDAVASMSSSEEIAQGHLHVSRAVVLARDFAKPGLQSPARHPGIDHGQVCRHGELHPIHEVEHFRPELQVLALTMQADVLQDGEVLPLACCFVFCGLMGTQTVTGTTLNCLTFAPPISSEVVEPQPDERSPAAFVKFEDRHYPGTNTWIAVPPTTDERGGLEPFSPQHSQRKTFGISEIPPSSEALQSRPWLSRSR